MISVIIPFYNAEPFLNRSLDSVLANTYQDFELWLINDGSTDASLEIAKAYESQYPNIYVIDKEHTGVSDTRNVGIEKANGEYIAFVDADDYIRPTYFEKMLTMMEENHLDWVRCESEWINENPDEDIVGNKMPPTFDEDCIITENTKESLKRWIFIKDGYRKNLPNPVMSLYKRDIIMDHNIRFDTEVIYGEDVLFNYDYVQYVERFGYVAEPLYQIILRNNSSQRAFIDMEEFFERTVVMLNKELEKIHQYGDEVTEAYKKYTISQIKRLFLESAKYEKSTKKIVDQMEEAINQIEVIDEMKSDISIKDGVFLDWLVHDKVRLAAYYYLSKIRLVALARKILKRN